MRKKIKDLTEEEIKNICSKFDIPQCNNGVCPLSTKKHLCKAEYLKAYGEEEIEVEK